MRWFLPVLLLLLSCTKESQIEQKALALLWEYGGIVRGDTLKKRLAMVFTGDEFADGGEFILNTLQEHQVKGSFFLTGNFYRKPEFVPLIEQLKADGHYLGAHSDRHLLYCAWEDRDSLLVSQDSFRQDIEDNYAEMQRFGIQKAEATFFLPPYEWYNDSISRWTNELDLHLINFTRGTRSHADFATPDLSYYQSSETILQSIFTYEDTAPNGLNGFLLLSHIGTDPRRTDKFYRLLPTLIDSLQAQGSQLVRVDELLPTNPDE
ncbi:MAG: polysaccharide deacetylase family protein [Bacteroidota bacterium]